MFIKLRDDSPGSGSEGAQIAIYERDDLGLCVLALAPFPEGTVVDSFSGEIGPDLRQHSLQVCPGMHISGTQFIGFLTHGCDPNCRLDMERFELVALRDIAGGELLTVDYAATEDVLYRQFECHCTAQMCRGWITGRMEDVNEEGRAVLAARTSTQRT
ncbi:SET domain-containing protein-lysine N-methyltransferase [Novosphingobium album (ex Hu et al. 2023)]|uniref:SET domain-containing protein-lysine N-methyltransferase n=1 Tax=Novosphingobium album (ex Hu et al. 2023) TaxID=2930093 RepID=A0ABT0AXF6_9SPHN|nr:SET domain-containing protein-lysine N-methyltransferase [Novosphingobium album (ex Hu et al. 2023)]MCJ2177490.1 SET domain-containing protein-lysine N-methyltransferase [Novosphingobium album (ex Hu et al. 2023)]